MKVAIVAGPDAGHAFPAFALATLLTAQGITSKVFTGEKWLEVAGPAGIEVGVLPGLECAPGDDDSDAGARLSIRAARMAIGLAPILATYGADVVISDVITVAGLWAADLCGLPAIELSPHPLYLPSRGLPPVGAGMAPGAGLRGRMRDTLLRTASNLSVRTGQRQQSRARLSIGLPGSSPKVRPRLIATLPALEVARPDWPEQAHLIGPLFWEPTTRTLEPPSGPGPLVVVAPSTAAIGALGMVDAAMTALQQVARDRPLRVVISCLEPAPDITEADSDMAVVAGLGRQDALLSRADLVICGGGHGMLAKALGSGVPVITVPGGGDQWELACRSARQGSGITIRPVSATAIAAAVRTILDDTAYASAAALAAASAADVVDPATVISDVVARTCPRGRVAAPNTPGRWRGR